MNDFTKILNKRYQYDLLNMRNDDRSSYLIDLEDDIYSVFSGKIDTIFDIEFSILSLLQNKFHVD